MGERLTAHESPHQAGDPAPPRPRTIVSHPGQTYFDHNIGCLRRSPIGPSWRCTCGEHGPIYRTEAEARAGKREHEAVHQR